MARTISMRRKVGRRRDVHVQREEDDIGAALRPADPPADIRRYMDGPAGLSADRVIDAGLDHHDVLDQGQSATGEGQIITVKTREEPDLLGGRDRQRPLEPELVDHAADVVVAVADARDVLAHALRADAPRDLLVDRHHGFADGAAQRLVAVPGLDLARHAVPFEDLAVGVAHRAVSRPISELGILKVEAGGKRVRARSGLCTRVRSWRKS